MRLLRWIFAAAIILSCLSACSQGRADHARLSPPHRAESLSVANHCCGSSITIFGSATFANSGFYAQESRSHLYFFGIRYDKLLIEKHFFAVNYSPEIIPAAFFLQPTPKAVLSAINGSTPPSPAEFAYGVGASPIGIRFAFVRSARVQPFVSADAGFLYFDKNVPSSFAAQFNFSASGEIGLKMPLEDRKSIELSYRFHHFSNAFEAADNPGVDSQMFYIGYTFAAWGHRR